ncbi:hypothetical protein BH23GEM9_BH23GEM9_19010 [soil metagenome]
MIRALLSVLAGVMAIAPVASSAQQAASSAVCPGNHAPTVDLADPFAQRLRLAQLDSAAPHHSLTIRRASFERKVPFCAPASAEPVPSGAIRPLPLRVRTLYNSEYPLNVNNGTVWAGAGLSGTLEGGADLRFGPVHASVYPIVTYQQNEEFPQREVSLSGRSPHIYAGHPGRIDWPQRHGDEAFWTIHPGQSSVWLEAVGAALGVSTENLWIGSAQRTPLMMSNTAPGFPHVFLGTARPVHTPIGAFEAHTFWGQLRESDYFDNDPDNDRNLLVGTSLVWEPVFMRGLFLGAHRSYVVPFDQPDWSFLNYILEPFYDLRGNPPDDNKLLSVFGRWVLPASRFEVYAEWGREDGWGEWVDLLREADHSQAFVLGLQKLTGTQERTFRWWAELAHLQHAAAVRGGRGTVTLYVHNEILQGYTNRGQLLGAWIGPGANSQIIGVDHIQSARSTGLAIERVRFDADAYYNQWARFYGETGHDASISMWLRHTESFGRGVMAAATASVGRRQNRHFVRFTGQQPADLHWETNAHLDLEVRWNPRR